MSRKKKIAVGAGVIVAGGILLSYVFRASLIPILLVHFLKPDVPFDPAKSPPPPDYADAASWAALPDKEDPSDWNPADLAEADNPFKDKVDVFYIHPTGFFGRHSWNAAMNEESKPIGIPTSAMLASQASAFNGAGRVFAPEYRQATLYSFAQPEREPGKEDGYRALELAYSDVARAFDYFIEHYNQGRPFIVVGHSQGSTHALRLIGEKIDKTDLYKRMIAAYPIGFGMPMDYFTRVYTNVKPGITPTQTNCVVTWDTLLDGMHPRVGGFHYYPTGWESSTGKERFCVNPLTWTPDEARAPASLNLGALIMDMAHDPKKIGKDALKGLVPGETWAQCHQGVLWVRDLTGTPYDMFMAAGGNYHLFDVHLFWSNIRQNVQAREQAYFAAHPA